MDRGTRLDDGASACVRIPSSFNYLILKLHAFYDRKDRRDETSDEGRHHAFDIFRIVTDMRAEDWSTARNHVEVDGQRDYLKVAAHIQRTYFHQPTGLGVIRLKENAEYRAHRDVFDEYVPQVVEDLDELFEGVEEVDE